MGIFYRLHIMILKYINNIVKQPVWRQLIHTLYRLTIFLHHSEPAQHIIHGFKLNELKCNEENVTIGYLADHNVYQDCSNI